MDQERRRASPALTAWMSHHRRVVGLIGATIVAVVAIVLVVFALDIGDRPASSRSTPVLVAQAQLIFGAIGLLLTGTLAATTIYYAVQSSRLVDEAQASRHEHAAIEANRHAATEARRIEGAAKSLIGAASDIVQLGSVLSVDLRVRRRWTWGREAAVRRLELAMQPVAAASKALDELRYLAPPSVVDRAGVLFDEILSFFDVARTGPRDELLRQHAERLRVAKAELQSGLADQMRCGS